MVLDFIPNSSVSPAKKNRTKKLKQKKLDARRKQWVLQVKNHGPKVDANEDRDNERDETTGVFEITVKNRDTDALVHTCSDSDSSSNTRVSGSNCSGTNFSATSQSSSSSSGTSYSGNICDDEEEDGGFDNWEAVADALAATGEQYDHKHVDDTNVTRLDPIPNVVNRQAWRLDDAFRPPCLPNLVKQKTFPMKQNNKYGHGGPVWVRKNVVSDPTPCPICCEDLDATDSSFLPCSCGFQLCLFCHNRILEEDGRCPGCRKPYENDAVKGGGISDLGGSCATLRLARSCSMITRS